MKGPIKSQYAFLTRKRLTDLRGKFTFPDGRTKEISGKAAPNLIEELNGGLWTK